MDFLNDRIYQEALQMVNFRMDAASERNYNIFGQKWYNKHFNWAKNPLTQEEFTTVLGQMNYDVAASTINGRSGDPVRSMDGFGEVKQKMFTYAHTYKLEAEDIKAIAIYRKMFAGNDSTIVNYIADKLMNVRRKAVNGIHERMDIMILTALSNAGKFTFSSTNDPNSPFVGTEISFGTPSTGTVTIEWTEANKDTVDVIEDLGDVVDAMDVTPVKVLMSKARAMYMMQTAKLRQYINGNNNASNPVTIIEVNNFLAKLGLPEIEIVNKLCRTQDGDKFNKFNPWNNDSLVFVPDDNFGTIQSTFSDRELGMESPGVNYTSYGRIEVSNWINGEKEGTNYTEYTKAKTTSVPSIDSIADMYQLTVETHE